MKNYDEIAKSVLARRDAHDAAVKRRHRIAVRVGIPVVSLCLAVSLGVGFRQAKKNDDPSLNVDDALFPGIDDTVDPGETEVGVFPPVPGGAMAGRTHTSERTRALKLTMRNRGVTATTRYG